MTVLGGYGSIGGAIMCTLASKAAMMRMCNAETRVGGVRFADVV